MKPSEDNLRDPLGQQWKYQQFQKRDRKGLRKYLKRPTAKMFPKVGKETLPQVEKVQKVPYRINQEETRRDTYYSNWPKLNTKKDIKSNKRTAAHNIRGNPLRLADDILAETLPARREGHVDQVMKGRRLQPRTPYPASLSLRIDRETKSLTAQQKLRGFSGTKPAFQQTLKELLQVEKKRPQLETTKLNVQKAHQESQT